MSGLRHSWLVGQDFIDPFEQILGAGFSFELDGDLVIVLIINDEYIVVRLVLHTGNKMRPV
jgi:hypothetical protein